MTKKAAKGLQPDNEPHRSMGNDEELRHPERADAPTTTASSSSGIGELPKEPPQTVRPREEPPIAGSSTRDIRVQLPPRSADEEHFRVAPDRWARQDGSGGKGKERVAPQTMTQKVTQPPAEASDES